MNYVPLLLLCYSQNWNCNTARIIARQQIKVDALPVLVGQLPVMNISATLGFSNASQIRDDNTCCVLFRMDKL